MNLEVLAQKFEDHSKRNDELHLDYDKRIVKLENMCLAVSLAIQSIEHDFKWIKRMGGIIIILALPATIPNIIEIVKLFLKTP